MKGGTNSLKCQQPHLSPTSLLDVSEPRLKINKVFLYRDSQYNDKAVVRVSYLCNGNSYASKTVSSYWDPPPHPESQIAIAHDDAMIWNNLRITDPLWVNPPNTVGFPTQKPRNAWILWSFIVSLKRMLNK